MTYEEYKALVWATYEKKKEAKEIPDFEDFTRSDLKEECLNILSTRHQRKDDIGIVKTFLGVENIQDLTNNIFKINLDSFRPLESFIKGETTKPKRKIVYFLAWLINFEPRPYRFEETLKVNEQSSVTPNNEEGSSTLDQEIVVITRTDGLNDKEHIGPRDVEENEDLDLEDSTNDKGGQAPEVKEITTGKGGGKVTTGYGGFTVDEKNDPVVIDPAKNRYVSGAILVVILILEGLIAYFAFYHENTFLRIPPAKKECMYWTGDHYEAVSCDSVVAGHQSIIPFNLDEWKYLRKITRPDTLTENDIGKVWYIKIKNDPEIFTFNGRYPLDTNRVLKPLSQHIYNTYIPKKKEVALLRNRLISGGIAFVVTLSVGTWWFFVALIRRRKKS